MASVQLKINFNIIFIILILSIPNTVKSVTIQELIIKENDKIRIILTDIEDKIDHVSYRMTALETWRDGMRNNIDKFYIKQIDGVILRTSKLEDDIKFFQNIMIALTIFASLSSFFITLFVTIWVSNRREKNIKFIKIEDIPEDIKNSHQLIEL